MIQLKKGLKNLEKNLKPKQNTYIFPKVPQEKPEDGEILPNQDQSPNYTIQVAPSSCEGSPLLNGENTDISFKEVFSKFYGQEQIQVQNSSPIGVQSHQFLKPIQKSNHTKEILIQGADGEGFRDQAQIIDYIKDLFYFASKLSRQDYEFKISKIKLIYFQGHKSLIIKFGDYLQCQFIYFSLYNKHYIHKEVIGENYKVFLLVEKCFNKKSNRHLILLRNLNSNITKELIEERFDQLIKRPLKIEGPFIIDQQAHSLIEMQNIEECELACKVFNQLNEKNKITKLNIKANICTNSLRKRLNNNLKNIFNQVKLKKIEESSKQSEQNKDSFYSERYQIIRQSYCQEDDYQKKKQEIKHSNHKKIIYEYEKFEKKEIIIKSKTYIKKSSQDYQSNSSDRSFHAYKNNYYKNKKSNSRSRSKSYSPKQASKQMKYRKNLQNLQNQIQIQSNFNDKNKINYKPKRKYSYDDKKSRNKNYQNN